MDAKKYRRANSVVKIPLTHRLPNILVKLQPKLKNKILEKNIDKNYLSLERSSVLDMTDQYEKSLGYEVKPKNLDK